MLVEIDAHKLPTLMVYNKIDLLDDAEPRIERNAEGQPVAVWLSALNDQGLDLLFRAVSERLPGKLVHNRLQLLPDQGALRSALYSQKAVLNETVDEKGSIILEIKLQESDYLRIHTAAGLKPGDLISA